jgi:hypothetical protein
MYWYSGTTNFFQVPVLETPNGAIFESNAMAHYGIYLIPHFWILINFLISVDGNDGSAKGKW